MRRSRPRRRDSPRSFPRREKDGRRPSRNEIGERNELRQEGRKKRPVPPDEGAHRRPGRNVERVVGGGRGTRQKNRKHGDLKEIDRDRDRSRRDDPPAAESSNLSLHWMSLTGGHREAQSAVAI